MNRLRAVDGPLAGRWMDVSPEVREFTVLEQLLETVDDYNRPPPMIGHAYVTHVYRIGQMSTGEYVWVFERTET